MKEGKITDVNIPVEVVLGGAKLTLAEISKLSEGSIVSLDKLAGEPVDFVAAGEKIGKGEVVVIDENFGIRITKMLEQE